MNPVVSIITPTYNHEKFIGQCIESVLRQAFSAWEMIIIDDASTDATPDIVSGYSRKDPRIKHVRHERTWGIYRLGDIYNQGLGHSQSPFIAVLEGDDYWPDYKLERQMRCFDSTETILSFGQACAVSVKGKPLYSSCDRLSRYHKKYFLDYRGDMKEPLLLASFIPAVTVITRKKSLEKIGGFQQSGKAPFTDYPTWLSLSFEGEFLGSSQIFGFWRRHPYAQSSEKILEIYRRAEEIAQDTFSKKRKKLFLLNSQSLGFGIKMSTAWAENIIFAYWIQGRACKVNNEREAAISNFESGIKHKAQLFFFTPKIIFLKLECFLGLLAVLFGVDIEKTLDILRGRSVELGESVRRV